MMERVYVSVRPCYPRCEHIVMLPSYIGPIPQTVLFQAFPAFDVGDKHKYLVQGMPFHEIVHPLFLGIYSSICKLITTVCDNGVPRKVLDDMLQHISPFGSVFKQGGARSASQRIRWYEEDSRCAKHNYGMPQCDQFFLL